MIWQSRNLDDLLIVFCLCMCMHVCVRIYSLLSQHSLYMIVSFPDHLHLYDVMCYVCLLPSASFSPINQLDMKVVRVKTPQQSYQGEIRCFNFNFTIYRKDIKYIAPVA